MNSWMNVKLEGEKGARNKDSKSVKEKKAKTDWRKDKKKNRQEKEQTEER